MSNQSEWPENIALKPSKEASEEAKIVKEVIKKTVDKPDEDALWKLIEKYSCWKAMRVTAWVFRFLLNCIPGKRHIGPLKTREIEGARNHWVKKIQQDSKVADGFEDQKEKLSLKTDQHGVLICYGRTEGDYPIYLPADHPFTRKLIMHKHSQMLHGGVNCTMTRIRFFGGFQS